MTPKFKAYKGKDGRLHLLNRDMFNRYIQAFNESDTLYVTIKKVTGRKIRSLDQNSYYWGVVISILCDYTGYEKEEMHEALKMKFLTIEPARGLPYTISTADLSTVHFNKYIEIIKRWASIEFGIFIPDPDSVENLSLEDSI